jgi:hypothetical protein
MSTLATNAITDASGGNTATINSYTPTESNMAGRNLIINGGLDVWQRGTSVSASSSNITYTADRFAARPNSSTTTTVSRSTSAPEGFSYSALITRDSGQTGTLTRFQTALETIDMACLRGRVVTLSFYAKADSGYTTASSSLPVVLYVGNGTERLRAITSYDNQTTPISDSVTLTTSWQRFTLTSTTLPSDLSQLTVAFEPAWSGTAPSNDGFYLTGVQLEVGSVATPFKHRSYGQELALCQRYYQKSYDYDTAPGTNTIVGSVTARADSNTAMTNNPLGTRFVVTMRTVPTLVTYSRSGTSGKISNLGSTLSTESSVVTPTSIGGLGTTGISYVVSAATGPGVSMQYTADAEL